MPLQFKEIFLVH